MAGVSVAFFCWNPASVFFSSVYTESIYAMATFCGMLAVESGYLWVAVAAFTATASIRSNGAVPRGPQPHPTLSPPPLLSRNPFPVLCIDGVGEIRDRDTRSEPGQVRGMGTEAAEGGREDREGGGWEGREQKADGGVERLPTRPLPGCHRHGPLTAWRAVLSRGRCAQRRVPSARRSSDDFPSGLSATMGAWP